jgi:hypothetical protein
MNAIFDFHRAGLLIRRYFHEKFRQELIYWSVITVFFMFFRNNVAAIGLLLFIAGAIFAARFSREMHRPASGINYFMIPATQTEKITVTILLTTFYYFAMMLLVYAIGNLAGTFIGNSINSVLYDLFHPGNQPFHHAPLRWELFETSLSTSVNVMTITGESSREPHIWTFFQVFLLNQAIFVLGGIYFKRTQAFKTFLSVAALQFLLLLLCGLEFYLIFKDSFSAIRQDVDSFVTRDIWNISKVLFWLLPPFLWVTSYFRLTEKQV